MCGVTEVIDVSRRGSQRTPREADARVGLLWEWGCVGRFHRRICPKMLDDGVGSSYSAVRKLHITSMSKIVNLHVGHDEVQ